MKPETKYKGSLKLSAIGDALGWMTEFEKTADSVLNRFGVPKIERFYNWEKKVGGRFYGFVDKIKAGSYSDDTQLLMAVARSIKSDGTTDHNYFAKTELPNWLDYARGGGRTVKAAAQKISRKSAQWNANFFLYKAGEETFDYKQSGANGAAMRVLPIALANIGNIEKIKEDIFCNSIITHGHPRAIIGAMLYGYAINQIIVCRPEKFNWESFLIQIGSDFQDKFNLSFFKNPYLKAWLNEWNKSSVERFETSYDATLLEVQNQLRYIYQSLKHGISIEETLLKLGCISRETKGSGTATVLAGLYFTLKFHDKPLVGIIEAVNSLGTDTDSIASFTGGLIGALHGQNIIPDKWQVVQDEKYLNTLAERLLQISEDRLKEPPPQVTFNLKRLNDAPIDDFNENDFVEFFPLGKGVITNIERQPTLTKGKYNLIMEIKFDSEQTIIFSKLYENPDVAKNPNQLHYKSDLDIITLAKKKLEPEIFNRVKDFLNKKAPKDLIDVLSLIFQSKNWN
ncbi:ADP-ribosylglycohydrolase [Mucilaginibacter yixingensis]|uniref:ADP-ribosylglycohydrolase n=1 Tax=Mucilaginibacter yixingensis TaxID=1295612 RepID=A0A2T5J5P7_9SPHI|nr:ADP-ribosylglycohydrolase family protein [Mucilaginibacter yixingensis]PTQ93540.1 ADP-ribosylglycohydrolase [Mucilaginibacter yixingensis]